MSWWIAGLIAASAPAAPVVQAGRGPVTPPAGETDPSSSRPPNGGPDQPWLPPEHAEGPVAAAGLAAPATPRAYRDDAGRSGLEWQWWYQHYAYRVIGAGGTRHGDGDVLRQVIDFQRDLGLAPGVLLHASNKLDVLLPLRTFDGVSGDTGAVNSLRELFVTVTAGSAAAPVYLDAGRINIRNGVGSGYNPTDFFKERAVLTATTRDPNALRTDRLGVVALRGQYLAGWGSATVALVPRLDAPSDRAEPDRRRGFGYLGLDRTNAAAAVFVKVAPRISERLSAELLALGREGGDVRFGTNVSALLGEALVGNLEAAAVRTRPAARPAGPADPPHWYPRAAANLTYTFAGGIEVTGEAIYAGDALSAASWRRYRRAADPATSLRLREVAAARSSAQEPLTRTNWFLRAAWRDAFRRPGLAVSAFALGGTADASFLWQGSIRQSRGGWTVGMLASGFAGAATSQYGALPTRLYLGGFVTRIL